MDLDIIFYYFQLLYYTIENAPVKYVSKDNEDL